MMPSQPAYDDVTDLVPEMRAWNDGMGIDPMAWVGCEGRIELAIGYALIFWPRFVLIDDHVLRGGWVEASLREWQQCLKGDRKAVEAVMNHWHMLDLHHTGSPATEAQLRYLGRTLRQIHEVKLRSDYPDRAFVVHFNDEPELDLDEYQLSFWQVGERSYP